MSRYIYLIGAILIGFSCAVLATPENSSATQPTSPAQGWLKSHRDLEQPYEPLGGPLRIRIRQQNGGVHAALPDARRLDQTIFGTPEMPKAFEGTPLITGVPLRMRETSNDRYTQIAQASPFGSKTTLLQRGRFTLEAVDATATDAAASNDSVQFDAAWEDGQGNSYSVQCSRVIPAGIEYPFFGGVVTNHILNGFSRIGTPLMPSGYAFAAFWGTGRVSKNGQITDEPILVHGMLTEMVRLEDYSLAFDDQIIPSQRLFHLIVPPFMPSEDNSRFVERPVKTGYTMENGEELPFWHVMFSNIEVRSDRIGMASTRGRRSLQTGNGGNGGNGSNGDNGDRHTNGDTPAAPEQGVLTSEAYRRQSPVIGMTDSLKYIPNRIQIPVNETVVWKNTSTIVHTVTADPAMADDPSNVQLPPGARTFNSGYIQPGQEYRYNFTVPGTYKYFCVPHEAAGMVGIIEVVEDGE